MTHWVESLSEPSLSTPTTRAKVCVKLLFSILSGARPGLVDTWEEMLARLLIRKYIFVMIFPLRHYLFAFIVSLQVLLISR